MFRIFDYRSTHEWLDVKLDLCEEGEYVAARLLGWLDMDAETFSKMISQASFNDKGLSFSSKQYIFFKVIESGKVDKLQVLRNLPSYDQIPLFLRDIATGKTTLDLAKESGDIIMPLAVQTIIKKQRIELEGGQEALRISGFYNNSL